MLCYEVTTLTGSKVIVRKVPKPPEVINTKIRSNKDRLLGRPFYFGHCTP